MGGFHQRGGSPCTLKENISVTHVDGLLALLPALREGVGDLPDGPEEVLARERPQLLRLLGSLGDGEREGGRAHRSQPQVPRQVRQQRRQRAQRLLLRQSKGTSWLFVTTPKGQYLMKIEFNMQVIQGGASA